MYFTTDRLLLIAVVMTLISLDGIYRAWRQRASERIDNRLFVVYVTVLALGSGLAWAGFFQKWMAS